eukprot:542540-Amphidinium_carterae.1
MHVCVCHNKISVRISLSMVPLHSRALRRGQSKHQPGGPGSQACVSSLLTLHGGFGPPCFHGNEYENQANVTAQEATKKVHFFSLGDLTLVQQVFAL